MKLLNLKLSNFRKISNLPDPTITFNQDINVLVGANNAGKTSILNAIQRLFKTEQITPAKDLNYLVEDGNLVIEGQVLLTKEQWISYLNLGLNVTRQIPINTFNLSDLAQRLLSKPITIKHTGFYIKKKQSNLIVNAEINKILIDELNKEDELLNVLLLHTQNQIQNSDFYNVFKSPLYLDSKGEILDREQFIPLNAIDEQRRNGGGNINIRGLLYALKKKEPEEFQEFKKRLLEIFTELNDVDVINNEDLGQFELILHENLRKNGATENVKYDINNVGQGMQTLVLMLSTILLLKPSIVLMDEPEVHMHPSLIKEFIKYIKLLSIDTQFIITTHSVVLINEVGLDKVFSLKNEISQKGIIVSKVDDKNKLLETINELGYDVDALTYTIKPSVFVFTEGPSDKDFILSFAEKAGLQGKINTFSTAFISMDGKGNRHKLPNLINKLNQEFIDSPLLMILDKDETTNTSIEEIKQKFFASNTKRLHYLSKRQIENYLIDEVAIRNIVAKKIKEPILLEKWQAESISDKIIILVDLQKEKIQENYINELFINDSLVTTVDIRNILDSIKSKPLNESVREFSAEMSKLITLRTYDLGQKTTSTIAEFENKWNVDKIEMSDGRELLKSIRRWVQEDYKVSFSNSELIDSMVEIPKEIHAMLVQLTKPEELKNKL